MINKLLEIINAVNEIKGKPLLKTLSLETSLRNDLDFDSFDLALLTAKIEDEFDVDIFEDCIIDKVSEIIAKLEK